ncbi:MAG: sulfurtransferase [Chloroflexi bacterium]|nr:sulfurtransferase [Chloroflexota bacterium]
MSRKLLTTKALLGLSLGLALLASACVGAKTTGPAASMDESLHLPSPAIAALGYARPELLVDTAWLAEHTDIPSVRIIDVRAAAKYQEGHILGAVNLIGSDYMVTIDGIPNMAPPPEQFAQVMSAVGVGDETLVVIYDEGNNLSAARLFWTLEYYGHKRVSLLNGGIAAWQAEGRDVTRRAQAVSAAKFTSRPDPSKLATKQEVLDALGKVRLVDARAPEEYAGTDVRAARGGHIPGAVNINWVDNLASGPVTLFKSAKELETLYKEVPRDQPVIAYCQTGVRAANTYFTLRLLGYQQVRNYDGSWAEWGNDPNTPLER